MTILAGIAVLFSSAAQAGMWDQFKDPDDGWIDGSNYLLEKQGSFLPVPIIISEPAVDRGLGLAAIFFHQRPESETRDSDEFVEPSISAAFAAYTGNDSYVLGGGHMGIWREDTVRYLGGAGYGSVNLEYFGVGDPDEGLKFNGEGVFVLQELQFRLGDSDWLIGGVWEFGIVDIEFDLGLDIPEIPPLALDFQQSGLGPSIEYDSLDSNFTPSKGQNFRFEALINDEAIGSDFDYVEYEAKHHFFAQLGREWVIGTRLEAAIIDGDAPFFAQPFIDMRGIPAMRYQGDAVVVAEIEARWDFHRRISAIGFVGVGKAADSSSGISDAESRSSYGLGIRYLAAKKMAMRIGLDVAKGPEDTVWYLTMGQAWD